MLDYVYHNESYWNHIVGMKTPVFAKNNWDIAEAIAKSYQNN